MKTVTIVVDVGGRKQHVTVPAYYIRDGLAVTPPVKAVPKKVEMAKRGAVITHVQSGRQVGVSYRSRVNARAALERLLGAGSWDLPEEKLLDSEPHRQAVLAEVRLQEKERNPRR